MARLPSLEGLNLISIRFPTLETVGYLQKTKTLNTYLRHPRATNRSRFHQSPGGRRSAPSLPFNPSRHQIPRDDTPSTINSLPHRSILSINVMSGQRESPYRRWSSVK